MLLLARTGLFALAPVTRAVRRAAVPRMAATTSLPRGNLGSSSEAEASYTLDGGYSLAPGEDFTGGWLAHRSAVDVPGSGPGDDWVRRVFEDVDGDLASAATFSPGAMTHAPRVLVLYGSLRGSSFSRRLAFECARVLELLGADVRVFDPRGLPVRDPELESDPKVQELRALSAWSEAHVWVSPEMHGCITGYAIAQRARATMPCPDVCSRRAEPSRTRSTGSLSTAARCDRRRGAAAPCCRSTAARSRSTQ